MMNPTTSLLIGGILAASTVTASAISYSAALDGLNAPEGSTFTASGGGLGLKTTNGTTILGVTGGPSGNEIDLGQSLTIHFTEAQVFSTLTIGLLYDGPEYGDHFEIAAALTDASTFVFTLTTTGTTTAVWNFAGATVTNLVPATINTGAAWLIENPFGDLGVTSVTFYPISSNPGGNESDFGIAGFETHRTPDSGSTALLFALALGGFTAVGLAMRKQAA